MGLKDVTLPSASIQGGGADFNVTGLSLDQLKTVVSNHFSDAKEFATKGQFDVALLATRSPDFVGEIIAVAAGEPTAAEYAKKLTLGTQVKALDTIWAMTIGDEEDFMQIVLKALDGFNDFTDKLDKQGGEVGKHIAGQANAAKEAIGQSK